MDFIIGAQTDVGNVKKTNQDSLSVKILNTVQGKMVFAVLCDGMGGLDKGEVASASVVHAFDRWVQTQLPLLCNTTIEDSVIREQWTNLIEEQNVSIYKYGAGFGINMGTTVVVMLLTQSRYYIMNIGDSRVYLLNHTLNQITEDHTLVAREVAMGRLTPEQAERDERRSILLQCVGASNVIRPDMFFGDVDLGTVFMLCSDGFRHEITPQELYDYLNPNVITDEAVLNLHLQTLINMNKERQERDNISVLLAKVI